MARKGELPAEAVSLDALDRVLEARRWGHLEKMAKGLNHEEYLKHVGRAAECEWLRDEVAKRLKHLRTGDDA